MRSRACSDKGWGGVPVEIEYDLGEADLLALTLFRLQRADGRSGLLFRRRLAYLLGFSVLAIGSWLTLHQPLLPVVFMILGAGFSIFYSQWLQWTIRRRVSSIHKDPRNSSAFAVRTLRAGDECLEEISPLGETKIKWPAIDDLTETPAHAFISANGVPSFIVPRDRLSKGDYVAFLRLCRVHIQSAASTKG
jgi:hypothetical protein